jgi:hypothetical protein
MLSLKGFHIFFIVASILLCLAVGAWGAQQFLQSGSGVGLATAVVFFIAGFALLVYGIRYFGKLRRLD